MKARGYGADYAVNVTSMAALIALLLPPSHNMIIYSISAGGKISIADLFTAGILPGLLLAVALMVTAYFVARRRGYPTEPFPGLVAVLHLGAVAVPGLLLVAIIFGGVRSGVFTATESSCVAVLYALLVTLLVYREMGWKDFVHATQASVRTTAMVLLIIGTAASFSWLMAFLQVPAALIASMNAISENPLVILLLLNVLMLFLGTFMDMGPTIIICTPIFLPVAQAYGVDPVHFGVIMVLNFGIGLNTPPVGAVQFVACAVGKISVGSNRTIWPFYAPGWSCSRWSPTSRPSRCGCPAFSDRIDMTETVTEFRGERKPKLSERVVSALRQQVFSGEITPGQKLPTESQLTETFGVSRTVIREAVATLAADGLVESRQGAGIFVRDHPTLAFGSISIDDGSRISRALNVLEVRMGIEIESAGLAALRRNSAQEARIYEAFFEFDRLLEGLQATGKTDFAFHRAIAVATNNPYYVEVLDALGSRTIPCDVASPWGTDSVLTREYQEGLQREHLAILKAISASDPEAARAAMRAHLTASQERYRGRMLGHRDEYLAGIQDAAKP